MAEIGYKIKNPAQICVSGTNEISIWILDLGPRFFSKIDFDALLATFGLRKTCTANLETKLYHQKKIFAPDNPPTRTIDRKRWEIAVFQWISRKFDRVIVGGGGGGLDSGQIFFW